jgi:hypothetical protein
MAPRAARSPAARTYLKTGEPIVISYKRPCSTALLQTSFEWPDHVLVSWVRRLVHVLDTTWKWTNVQFETYLKKIFCDVEQPGRHPTSYKYVLPVGENVARLKREKREESPYRINTSFVAHPLLYVNQPQAKVELYRQSVQFQNEGPLGESNPGPAPP